MLESLHKKQHHFTFNLEAIYYSWFFSDMKRADAEKLLLKDNATGTYLIRESGSLPENYSLSVRMDDNKMVHYRIKKTDTGSFYLTQQKKFRSLIKLVQHYSRDADGLSTPLTTPCPKTDLPSTIGLPYIKEFDNNWEIEHQSIKLEYKLNSGEFSEVWKGTYNGTSVAVKTLIPGKIVVSDFLAEAQIMKKLQHKKLIKLYGVCTHKEPIYIVTELMKHGNLLDYLTKGEGQHFKLSKLIKKIGAQVANGMAYLESQHYIHRDLAARNVLVGEGNIVKIGGFALARQVVGDYYLARGENLPVKWTAPEATLFNQFTIKSDVWSYGVFLTELVTHGGIPYSGMTNDKVLAQVEQGYRMPPPHGCPDLVYQIMLDCWKTNPEERPTFEHLKHQLKDHIFY